MDDYINRKKLLEHVKNLPTWWADDGGVYGTAMKYYDGMFDCEDVINSIENAESENVSVVIFAHWEKTSRIVKINENTGELISGFECSNCKRFTRSNFRGTWNYCPNCGAKMLGENDNG